MSSSPCGCSPGSASSISSGSAISWHAQRQLVVFGRIANFINGELWGKPSNVPWAMVFPNAPGNLPRHPSQLYEATMEGLLLFLIMLAALRRFGFQHRPGLLAAIFLTGYGVFRFIAEIFREPDTPFIGWFSLGMAFSIPMWLGAAYLYWNALRPKPQWPANR